MFGSEGRLGLLVLQRTRSGWLGRSRSTIWLSHGSWFPVGTLTGGRHETTPKIHVAEALSLVPWNGVGYFALATSHTRVVFPGGFRCSSQADRQVSGAPRLRGRSRPSLACRWDLSELPTKSVQGRKLGTVRASALSTHTSDIFELPLPCVRMSVMYPW